MKTERKLTLKTLQLRRLHRLTSTFLLSSQQNVINMLATMANGHDQALAQKRKEWKWIYNSCFHYYTKILSSVSVK